MSSFSFILAEVEKCLNSSALQLVSVVSTELFFIKSVQFCGCWGIKCSLLTKLGARLKKKEKRRRFQLAVVDTIVCTEHDDN